MTIRALKEKLSQYDNDAELTFEVDGVFEPTSITITKQYCEAHIHNELRVEDITKRNNNCLIVLGSKGSPLEQEPKTDKLYRWLNYMRLGIAPDETTPQDERAKRLAQVEVIDSIMEWLESEGAE